MKVVTLLLSSLLSLPAFATGGFACTADDATVMIDVKGVTTRGMGSPILTAEGTLIYKPTDGQPPTAEFKFSQENFSQYWNSGDTFSLFLYVEDYTGKDSYETSLVIETKGDADGEIFKGTYKVATNQNVNGKTIAPTASGAITCSLE